MLNIGLMAAPATQAENWPLENLRNKSNYRQSWNGVYQEESLTVSGRPVAPGPELARSVARNRSESVDCRFTRDAFRLSRGRVRNQDDGVRDPSAYGPVVMAVCTK
jgi:hypothetical protein